MSPSSLRLAVCAIVALGASAQVVPGKVLPTWPQSWQLNKSTIVMTCNSSGRVDADWAAQWALVDLDWNGDKVNWAATKPMSAEEDMFENAAAIKAVNPNALTFVYRNGVKALPWHTSVRNLLEDKSQWGLFMPLAGCMPTPGHYICGNGSATDNL
jgi:hypothetical protein